MWTDWLERILRPRERDEEKLKDETARAAMTGLREGVRPSRFGPSSADVKRSTRESVEETL